MNLKKAVLGVSLSALLITVGCQQKKEGVAATVNGVDIPMEEFVKNYASQRNNLMLRGGSTDVFDEKAPNDPSRTIDEVVKENVLNDLVQINLIKQDAKTKGIEPDEKKAEEELAKIKEQVGGQENFDQQLKTTGANEAFYKEYFVNADLMSRYTQKLQEELKPTEEEMKTYYDEHQNDFFVADADHILVDDVDAANKLKKELDKGADFAQMAKENSTDPGSAEKGGKLGSFEAGTMVTEFEEVLPTLKKGEYSDPVKSQFGYHIIKLNDFQIKPFDEVKAKVEQAVVQEKFNTYIEKLQKDAKIDKYVDYKEAVEIPAELQLPKETLDSLKQAEQQAAQQAAEQNAKTDPNNAAASEQGTPADKTAENNVK
ncbi:peptidylprolyl isomerase [Peptoniphilus equinus]|uniref:peptidylprolyl isomerase n=1 Tax=Peptoniphilus equinus TaxID=3016343 RepID=A0ABY7QRU5_9FIRM|nr:peptidylprolyl isomerase [Peptoniphilus equinus]WBW49503.1 peptidylprolyl isomerase [Peptoniphilus equinus]